MLFCSIIVKVIIMSVTERKEIANKLTKTMLEPILIRMALEGKIHGYEAISRIRKEFNIYFGSSTVYPLFEKLEKKGYLESKWEMNGERPVKVYTATPEAETFYNAYIEQLDQFKRMHKWNDKDNNTTFIVETGNEVSPKQRLRKSAR
jgi:PadR family transcriptional regulator PadR